MNNFRCLSLHVANSLLKCGLRARLFRGVLFLFGCNGLLMLGYQCCDLAVEVLIDFTLCLGVVMLHRNEVRFVCCRRCSDTVIVCFLDLGNDISDIVEVFTGVEVANFWFFLAF